MQLCSTPLSNRYYLSSQKIFFGFFVRQRRRWRRIKTFLYYYSYRYHIWYDVIGNFSPSSKWFIRPKFLELSHAMNRMSFWDRPAAEQTILQQPGLVVGYQFAWKFMWDEFSKGCGTYVDDFHTGTFKTNMTTTLYEDFWKRIIIAVLFNPNSIYDVTLLKRRS